MTGKCKTCEILSFLRSKFSNAALKGLVNESHACHLQMYMQERIKYHERRREAIGNPTKILSCISDGMATAHSIFPFLANLNSVSKSIEQKKRGVLDHGRKKFTMYRAFPCVQSNTNLNIFTFLSNLEDWRNEMGNRKDESPWPEKLHWQIDGGAENKTVLAICEHLVAVTPIQSIILTRLPVGHTHDDIDAKFGAIWTGTRSRYMFYIYALYTCVVLY